MTRASRLLPVLLAALVLAGCSTSGNTPESYPERHDISELGEPEAPPAPENVSTNDFEVWRNYYAACMEANADLDPDVAVEVCTCSWDAYVDDVPFEVFLEFDKRIRERIGDVGDNRADLEQIARNVVVEYNNDLPEGETAIDVDLIALMEGCQPRPA